MEAGLPALGAGCACGPALMDAADLWKDTARTGEGGGWTRRGRKLPISLGVTASKVGRDGGGVQSQRKFS